MINSALEIFSVCKQLCGWKLMLLTYWMYMYLVLDVAVYWGWSVSYFDWQLSILAFLMVKPEYLVRTRSIPWLLISCRCITMSVDTLATASPGHQQPWYWLCRINVSLSLESKNFSYLYAISVLLIMAENANEFLTFLRINLGLQGLSWIPPGGRVWLTFPCYCCLINDW